MKENQYKIILKMIVTIISWTLFSLLILILAFLAYYLIATKLYEAKGDKYEPKFSLYTIVSPSMEPQINVYDVVINVRVDDKSQIKPGDVITFTSTSNISDGMTVTHRVKNVINGPNGLEFVTQGDNNMSEDSDTAKDYNVIGKVIMKVPQLGRIQFFIASWGGWFLVVLAPALYIIVSDIFKIFKLSNSKKKLDEIS